MTVNSTMQAAVLHGPLDLRLEEVPTPERGPDDVLVEIRNNGICGSDIHFYLEGKLGPYVVSKPYIPGHEAGGVVVESATEQLKPGQRVAIEPGIPCRHCLFCKNGRYNLCEDVRFLSAPPENGTFAQYVSVPWDYAHPVPDGLSEDDAAFVEPVSVGVQACERGGLGAGATVAIIGAGPIGLILSLVARAYGASRIFLIDVLEHRLTFARDIGADGAILANADNPVGSLLSQTAGVLADYVFDTSGSSQASATAPLLARRGGTVVLVGWPETPEFPFPVEQIIEKELNIHGVNRYCNTYPKAISLIARKLIDLEKLVSHRYTFGNVVEAFDFASKNRTETVKVMVSR